MLGVYFTNRYLPLANTVFPQALIRHYCYEKYFNHAVNTAAAAQRKFSNAPIYSFFHAYGTLMQGKPEEVR